MMNKFWFLTQSSFLKKIKSKWFLIVNILLLVVIVGIVNVDSIIKAFGGDFNDTNEIVVLDKTDMSYDLFEKNLKSYNETLDMRYTFDISKTIKTEEEIKKEIKDTDKVLIVLENSDTSYLKASIISDSYIDTMYYQLLYQALSTTKTEVAFSLTDTNKDELLKLTSNISVDRILLSDDKNTEEENMEMIMGTVFPTVILPFFILVVFLVQMIGAEINEEKQTRSMEVIISNVSPKAHFFSKVVASNGFVLLQGLLLILYGILALVIRNYTGISSASSITSQISDVWNSLVASGFVDKLTYIIPLTLILMVLSFLTYSLVAGILASMTVSMEDYQQIQAPIMMICLAGYYLAIMAGMFQGSTLIRILSYVPFLSCLLSPALLVIGQIGIFDVVISIIILCIFNYILIRYGLRIYKIGILNYSTDKMWSKLLKAVRSKES
ncbi:ABC transporter permease [bacterium]|nr:ABC transporter permease [bacterium]